MEDGNVKYGIIYSEIVQGYSYKNVKGEDYFFKHPTQSEHFNIYSNYEHILSDAQKRGLMTEQQKLDQAISNEWWTSDKENRFRYLKETIVNLNKTKGNLVLPSQKAQIQERIDKTNFILTTFIKERNEIIGYTAERYANDRLYDETILSLTFKNRELTQRVFPDKDEYYYLSDDAVENIRDAFHASSNSIMSSNIRYIAACPFFQNLLYITNECDAFAFWGKASSQCTKYQTDLLVNGKMFKNAVKQDLEGGKSIPDDVLSNPDKFLIWFEARSSSVNSQSSSSSKTAVGSFVGATKDDLDKMGVKVEKIKGKSLLDLAAESGGVLRKHDYLNARGSA